MIEWVLLEKIFFLWYRRYDGFGGMTEKQQINCTKKANANGRILHGELNLIWGLNQELKQVLEFKMQLTSWTKATYVQFVHSTLALTQGLSQVKFLNLELVLASGEQIRR